MTVRTRWTKGVRAKAKHMVGLVAATLDRPVYAFQAPSHDPKKRKFIQDLGGTFDHFRWTEDGERAELFRFFGPI